MFVVCGIQCVWDCAMLLYYCVIVDAVVLAMETNYTTLNNVF